MGSIARSGQRAVEQPFEQAVPMEDPGLEAAIARLAQCGL